MTRCAELTILRQKFTLDTNPMNLTQLTLYSTINSENIIKELAMAEKNKDSLNREEEENRKHRSTTPNAGLETIIIYDPDDEKEKKSIITAFSAMFGHKPGFELPVPNKEGHLAFKFAEKGDAEKFFSSEAANGRCMVIVDAKTQTVMGYSNGDGTLYHSDGRPFDVAAGDTLEPSNIPAKGFQLPQPPAINNM